MKRIFTSLLVGCILLTSTIAHAQGYSPLSFGVKAGLSLPTTNQDGYEMKTGFSGGVVVDYELSKNFFLRSGIDFVMKGAKLDKDIYMMNWVSATQPLYQKKDDIRLNYLQIPIAFGYKNEIGNGFTAYINAGSYFGFGVYGKGKTSYKYIAGDKTIDDTSLKHDSFDDLNLKKFDFGVMGSIGVEYRKYFINVGYEYGLTNLAKQNRGESWHNMVGTCTLGYKF